MRLRLSGNYSENGHRFLIGYEEDVPGAYHGFEGKYAGASEILDMLHQRGVYREVPVEEIVASGPTHAECAEALGMLVNQD